MGDNCKVVEPKDAELVNAYWEFQRLSASSSRTERTATDDYFWAYNVVNDLVCDDAAAAVVLLEQLLDSPAADKRSLAYGPIEDLLAQHPAWCAEHLPEKCRKDPQWMDVIRLATVDDEVESQLGELSRYRRQP
jgi:hypothetical protein